ncbi:hypothetical protein [Rhizobium sp. R635]|uniref:hypothetical protein n=1 Tax=Rhizobium sp. R635 TaxID=1764275 RepID=UPI001130596B|nr:hypothetical protein [Rhizobium sp. R635]
MKTHVRASIAAIALADSHGRKVSGVYSYSGEGHVNIEAETYGNQIKAWDYSKGGAIEGNFPDLYHYGESAHIEMRRVRSGRYEGYDYGTGSHFECTVNGSEAEIYDYGASGYFTFSI